MRALVTGGAGFIGSNVVGLLLQRGHEVLVLDDLSSGYRDNLRPEATFREADVRSADTLRTVAAGCSAIFHLAASVGNKRSIDDPRHDAEVNLVGMVSVLEAARANSIDKVVFSSSAGIFGELKTLPIDEDHPQDPDRLRSEQAAAEKLALVYNKLHGMHNVCLRYFNVYGPHQRYDAYGNVIPILRSARSTAGTSSCSAMASRPGTSFTCATWRRPMSPPPSTPRSRECSTWGVRRA